ncbi:hypothetical protein TrVFT333_010367 [Trichoderma virens FT-333]|nr:hypothetical protein TrVFT333_010367 [Trichoderma virens FT-333]
MASQRKALRDWIYLLIIGTQLLGMLAIDLVAFYPKELYQPPLPPPLPRLPPRLGLVQFPLAAYLVYQLASTKATSGPAELAGLAFGSVTFMGSAACCFELLHMGDDMVSADKKGSLLYGTYLPFAVIPALLAVDMYLRLLPRVSQPGSKAKTQ